jgi:shikimate dehydrogenase
VNSEVSRNRLAVLGSPIAHSKSPVIQRAAFDVLGLDWTYDAIDITADRLTVFIDGLDASWRGLSLTMPLKRDVLPLLARRHELVDVVGGANTVLMTDDGLAGFNTDVEGALASLRGVGVTRLDYVHILGAGATASSLLVAVAGLGATRVVVSARTPDKARSLVELGARCGVDVVVRAWGVLDRSLITPDAIISTVPGGSNDLLFAEPIRQRSVLFDVAYDPWPSELARSWMRAGGTVISGLDLLVNQALGQLRVFVNGDPDAPLAEEKTVLEAMRAAVA